METRESLSMSIDDFGRFWNIYPRRSSVVATRQAWEQAIFHADPEIIIEAAQKYANDKNRDEEFTLSSARWLAEQRWLDSPLPPRKLSPEELKQKELAEAQEIREKERQRSLEAAREDADRKAKAVPLDPEIKRQLLEKWARNVYPRP